MQCTHWNVWSFVQASSQQNSSSMNAAFYEDFFSQVA